MRITVEFYGIPRARAGTAVWQTEAATLGELLRAVGQRFPALEGECLSNGCLASGYTANLNGDRFVTDPATPLAPGDSVLLLSADAGG
ncbi:MAG: MoaD/ThiS family protein [Pirellulales bacterium]|jgi:molybdopterin converting factor small subunit|nr:MoaD/ThiS family protein [Pirellulales bacterium]